MTTTVYILLSADQRVLYVGMTINLEGRILVHRRSAWGSAIAHVQFEEFSSPEAARQRESVLINELRPEHNRLIPSLVPRTPARRSPTMLLIAHRLGGESLLPVYVEAMRSRGMSWLRIAQALKEQTGTEVTPETVRGWYVADQTHDAEVVA